MGIHYVFMCSTDSLCIWECMCVYVREHIILLVYVLYVCVGIYVSARQGPIPHHPIYQDSLISPTITEAPLRIALFWGYEGERRREQGRGRGRRGDYRERGALENGRNRAVWNGRIRGER